MKDFVHGAAFVAVLVLSASAWAQVQPIPPATNAPTIKLPEPSQGPPAATPAPATPQTARAAPSTPRPKRHVRRTRRYARSYPRYEEDYYREEYYGRGGSPDDYMADELNTRQLPSGWYGGGAQYPMAHLLTGLTRHHGPIIRGATDRADIQQSSVAPHRVEPEA